MVLAGLIVASSSAFRRPTTTSVSRIALVSSSVHNRQHPSKTTVTPSTALCLRGGGEGSTGISDKDWAVFIIGSIATIPLCEKVDISSYILGYACLYQLYCLNELYAKIALPSKVEHLLVGMLNYGLFYGMPMLIVGSIISRILGRFDLRKPPNRIVSDILFGSGILAGFVAAFLLAVEDSMLVLPLAIMWFLGSVGAQQVISPRVDDGSWVISSKQLKVLDFAKGSLSVACVILGLAIIRDMPGR